jgi:hypothetical protein
MAVKFTNNAKTTLASGINSTATSATVADGSVFPTLEAGEYFYCTFDDDTNNEIVKVTARSSNTLTIVRGVDNTTARAFLSGDAAELRATSALLTDIQANIAAKSANQTVYNATTASSATAYDIGIDPGVEGNAMVFLNGLMQHHDTFSFSGSTLTLDTAPADGMALEVIVDNLINLQSSNLTVDTFTAADVGGNPQVTFTLSDAPAAETNLIVFVDGVFQANDTYTISNLTLSMTDGVTAGLTVTVYVMNPVNIGAPSDGTVTTSKLSGNITMPGTLTVGAFDVAFDSPTFFVDHTNSRVGLGTASPTVPVDIVGDVKMSAALDVAGAVDLNNLTINTAQGTDGQLLTSTGSGVAWEDAPAGTTINNNADNRIITGSGTANTLEGESNFTFDGTTVEINNTGNADSTLLKLKNTPSTAGTYKTGLEFWSNEGTANNQTFNAGRIYSEFDGINYANTRLTLGSASGNGSFNDEVNIINGKVGIGTTSPNAPLEVSGGTGMTGGWGRSLLLRHNFPVMVFQSEYSTDAYGAIGYDNSTGMNFMVNSPTIDVFANSQQPAMFIRDDKNIGIGTTSPASKLHLESGNAHNKLSITSTASGGTGYDAVIDLLGSASNSECAINMGINGDADREAIKTYQSAMTFRTNNVDRMKITSAGEVQMGGVLQGDTSLNVTETRANQYISAFYNNHSSPYGPLIAFTGAAPNNATNRLLTMSDTSAQRATFYSNGGLYNYQSNDSNLSDEREKKNIEDLSSTWDCVKSWNLRKFHYNEDEDSDDKRLGVIAQEVEAECPEIITEWKKQEQKDEVLWTEEDELPEGVSVGDVKTAAQEEIMRKGVKEQQMYWMAIKALQEAMAEIETLKTKVETLENA